MWDKKRRPCQTTTCRGWWRHSDTCGATVRERRNKRETVRSSSRSAESQTKREWREESFMRLVMGHQSQASAPPPTHGPPTPPPCLNLSPILNNSLRSHSLPPEGLVSWRHQRDDLTAPERSGFSSSFFYPAATLHPQTRATTHTIIPANSLIRASCSAVPPLG